MLDHSKARYFEPSGSATLDSLLLFRLKRQRWLIVPAALLMFVTLSIGFQFLPASYKASAFVTVDSHSPHPPVVVVI